MVFYIRIVVSKLIIAAIVLLVLPFSILPFLSEAGRYELLYNLQLVDKQFILDLPYLVIIAIGFSLAIIYFMNIKKQ